MNLADVLDRATDRIEPSRLAERALAAARRRRMRNRGVAIGAAAAAVATVVVVTQLPGGEGGRKVDPSGPSETPTVTTPPRSNAIGPWWDPFTVEDAPLTPSVLPGRLEPPSDPPSVFDRPMDAAVVAWPEEGQDLRILGVDGGWRSVPGTATAVRGTLRDVVDPALSIDGRQVAMSTNDGILVVDLVEGSQELVPWPGPISQPWDTAPALEWLPEDEGFLVLHWRHPWLVRPDGTGERAPYEAFGVTVSADGSVVEKRWDHQDLRVWRDGEIVSDVAFPYWGERVAAGYGRIALTGAGNGLPGHGGPMLVDAMTGGLLAYRPIRDPSSVYSNNGHLTAVGFLDADTPLYLVGPADFRTMDPGDETWHAVAWHTDTGEFERLTSGNTQMRDIDVAGDVLAGLVD